MTSFSMGALWSRQGFTSINADQCALLSQALITMKPTRPAHDVKNDELFATRCKKWQVDSSSTGQTNQAIINATSYMVPTPAYAHFIVTGIICDVNTMRVTELTPHDVVWRWPYYQFAYTVYWALLYHEPNAMLQNPEFLAAKILRIWECLYSHVADLPSEAERGMHLKQLFAALFERTLGLQCDISERRPCWSQNIADRRELGRRAKAERIGAFADAVEFLLAKWQNMVLVDVRK